MDLSFACPRCEEEIPVRSDDDIPDLLVKVRRVERACQACGHRVEGLDAPESCPNDSCPDPSRGWQPAERIVSTSFSIPVCADCQAALDTEAELRAAI